MWGQGEGIRRGSVGRDGYQLGAGNGGPSRWGKALEGQGGALDTNRLRGLGTLQTPDRYPINAGRVSRAAKEEVSGLGTANLDNANHTTISAGGYSKVVERHSYLFTLFASHEGHQIGSPVEFEVSGPR